MGITDITDHKGRPMFAGMEMPPEEHVCGECVRYTQDWRNPERYYCSEVSHNGDISYAAPACGDYWDRKAQEKLDAEHRKQDEEERQEKVRKNWNNPPKPPRWDCDILPNGKLSGAMPFCPNCGEPLYDTDRCYFCGQAILQDEAMEEFQTPSEEEHMDCLFCGGKGTLIYTRSRYNGHLHGRCTKCGASIIE